MIYVTLQQALMRCTHFLSDNNETTRENIPLNDEYISISDGGIGDQVIAFNDSIRLMKSIGLIKCNVTVDTKEGQRYVLEIYNAFDFIKHTKTSFFCTNQVRPAGVILEETLI